MVEKQNSKTSALSSVNSIGSNTPMFLDSTKGNIKEQYHFKEKLANGGFGVVYLAEHRVSKELFAVKAIQKKKVKDYATFVNEINILKVLVSAFLADSAGPPAHHQAARDLGVERRVLPGAGVRRAPTITDVGTAVAESFSISSWSAST